MKQIMVGIFFLIIFLGCSSDSSSNQSNLDNNSDKPSNQSNLDNNSDNSSNQSNLDSDINHSLSFTSNEIQFGDGDFQQTSNFINGDFGTITYPDTITEDIFKLTFQLETVEESLTNIIIKIDEVNSQRVVVVIFPNIKFLSDKGVDTSKSKEIYLYGIKSDGTPLSTSIKIENLNSIIYSHNGSFTIELSQSIDMISAKLGTSISLESYIKPSTTSKIIIGWTNISIVDGLEVSSIILDGFKGDLRSSIDNKIANQKTYGLYGNIEIK